MFDVKGIINIDKFFLEKYNYVYTNYEDLVKQPFIEYEGVGANAICWIKDGLDRYLFKEIKQYPYCWLSEVLSEKIAKILDIPCADYRYATLGNKKGILTKNFLKDDETLILGAQIIQEVLNKYPYLKENDIFNDKNFLNMYRVPTNILSYDNINRIKYIHNNLNNIEEVWSLLDVYLTIHDIPKDNLENIIDYLVKMYFFDLITFQKDRHITNWGIIKLENMDIVKPSVLFDHSASFGLVDKNLEQRIENFYRNLDAYLKYHSEGTKQNFISVLYKDRMLFTPSEDAIINAKYRKRQNNLETFSYFLEVSTSNSIESIKEYMEILNNLDIKDILDEIENFYNIKIDSKIYNYVADMFSYNIYFLNQKIKKYERKMS